MAMDELMALGQKVDSACVACHQPNGEGLAGVFPRPEGQRDRHRRERRAHPHRAVRQGRHRDAGLRQAAEREGARRGDHLPERNAWGNAKGDMVQPADITAAIEKGE